MSSLASEYNIEIAEFIIKVVSDSKTPLFIEPGYIPFLSNNETALCDVYVNAVSSIPDALLSDDEMIFSVKNNQQNFWSIHKHNNRYKVIVYDQKKVNKIQQIAITDSLFKNWTIYMDPIKSETGREGIWPLLYPMGPLIMYYLTVSHEAIMIHASGIFDGSKGRIFSGFSGVGKSTMAHIWEKAGSVLINDDRVMIRKKANDFFIYNTPMFYKDNSKSSRLNAIYLPRHAPKNAIEKLYGAKAVSKVLTNCIQQSYNPVFIKHHLRFLSDLIQHIPVFSIDVVPNNSIIGFIKSNDE